MEANIIKIGNSKGVIIPAAFLRKVGAVEKIEIQLRDDGLFIKPLHKPREGWEAAAKKAHQEKDDTFLIPDVFEDETMEEWTW
jgi:antitoxin MazE